jgi:hypothetical protein
MFGDACKGGILLFSCPPRQYNGRAHHSGAGYAGSIPSEEPAGYTGSRAQLLRDIRGGF